MGKLKIDQVMYIHIHSTNSMYMYSLIYNTIIMSLNLV